MASLNKCMAEEFSAEKTYALEALVVYNEKLYICTNADYVAGEFSLDNFEQTTLAELLSLGSLMDNCIAPPYDGTSTYAVGDIVEYKKKIYSCITAVDTAEEFDSEKWECAYMANGFNKENGNLDYNFTQSTYTTGSMNQEIYTFTEDINLLIIKGSDNSNDLLGYIESNYYDEIIYGKEYAWGTWDGLLVVKGVKAGFQIQFGYASSNFVIIKGNK